MLLLAIVSLQGCGLLLDVGPSPEDRDGSVGIDATPRRDGAPGDAAARDADTMDAATDAGARDGGALDATADGTLFDGSSGDAATPDAGTATEITIWATRAMFAGDFGGLSAADAHCRMAATAVGITLPTWALLSDSTTDARDRVPRGAPIRNSFGDDIAANHADLFDGSILRPVAYDEAATLILGNVWTGSDPDGTRDEHDSCSDWSAGSAATAELGRTERADQVWISLYHPSTPAMPCAETAHLYCISVQR